MKKKILASILSFAMIFSAVPAIMAFAESNTTVNVRSASAIKNVNTDISYLSTNGEQWDGIFTGHRVTFGKFGSGGEYNHSRSQEGIKEGYAQCGTENDYNNVMTYRVLKLENGQALLDCDNKIITLPWQFGGIDVAGKNIEWGNSDLRKWLNGDEFYNNNHVFTSVEKNAIVETKNDAKDEYKYHSNIFNSNYCAQDYQSNDKVFLLSIDEVNNYYGEKSNALGKQWETYDYYNGKKGNKQYAWTRSSSHSEDATGEELYGGIATYGYMGSVVDFKYHYGTGQMQQQNTGLVGVSPAFNIDTSKIFYTYEAGKNKPTKLENVKNSDETTWTVTLKDGNNDFRATAEKDGKIVKGEDLPIRVASLGSAVDGVDYTQLSGFIYNEDKSEVLAYGKVGEKTTGNVSVNLPDSVKNTVGKYVLRVFAEDVNSSAQNGLTDYSSNYVDIPFEVQKLSQTAPTVASIPETIKGQTNGKITGVTSAMEYRKEGDSEYTSISDNEITGLPAGTYFVRYKEDENHAASEETKVTIAEGRQLNITVPTEQTGYELTVDKNTADWHGEAKLTFKLKDGYSKTDEFAVMVNGETVTLDDQNSYTISNLEKDADITVIGVADTTAPTGTIAVGEENWESFEKDITFDIFYKEKQNVKITAQDNGSGVKNISYYVADKAMTKEEIEALSEESWTVYDSDKGIDLSENGKYVIYAKVTDNAGNTSYISSNGMVMDTSAPAVKGIESGNTYTKSTEITVTDENLATVTVDGVEVTLDENGKYILVPKSGVYTIVVTDKAGNTTTIDNVTVNKEVPSVTEPTVSQETLTYDGTEQTLITAGQTIGGKLEYSLDGENWSSELPTAKNAGTYDVRYRVAGDTDYQDVEEKTLTVTIAPKVIGITWSNTQFTYNGHTQQPTATATGVLQGENCEITVKGGQKAVGKYIATAAEVSNSNYVLPETGITTEFEIKAQKKPQNNNTAPEVNANRNKNTLSLNAGLKVSQIGNKINISWGKVQGAKGYDVYVQYCGKSFNAKSLNQVKSGNKTKITVKKVNGKKLNLKKNYKIYVVAYNYQGKKKVVLAKSIVAHIVGRKNTKETNVKAIRLNKSKFTLKTGRTAIIKGKTILVNAKKKPLSDKHAKTFRYASSNKKIATVSKNGKIKAVAKGKCTIYVYARNGYTKKVQVTVK